MEAYNRCGARFGKKIVTRVNKRNGMCEERGKSDTRPYLMSVEHRREGKADNQEERQRKSSTQSRSHGTNEVTLSESIRSIRPSVLPFAFTVLSLPVRPFPLKLRFLNIWIIVLRWWWSRCHGSSSRCRSSLSRPPSARQNLLAVLHCSSEYGLVSIEQIILARRTNPFVEGLGKRTREGGWCMAAPLAALWRDLCRKESKWWWGEEVGSVERRLSEWRRLLGKSGRNVIPQMVRIRRIRKRGPFLLFLSSLTGALIARSGVAVQSRREGCPSRSSSCPFPVLRGGLHHRRVFCSSLRRSRGLQ
jgi:hypothetical protein